MSQSGDISLPLVPNHALYQAKLRPEYAACCLPRFRGGGPLTGGCLSSPCYSNDVIAFEHQPVRINVYLALADDQTVSWHALHLIGFLPPQDVVRLSVATCSGLGFSMIISFSAQREQGEQCESQ